MCNSPVKLVFAVHDINALTAAPAYRLYNTGIAPDVFFCRLYKQRFYDRYAAFKQKHICIKFVIVQLHIMRTLTYYFYVSVQVFLNTCGNDGIKITVDIEGGICYNIIKGISAPGKTKQQAG